MMQHSHRIVALTAGLTITGAMAGGIAGGTALTICFLVTPPHNPFSVAGVLSVFLLGGLFGAPLGGVTAPILAWLLMRHVPLGKMFLVCSVGTAIGGIVGWFVTTAGGNIMLNPLVSAFVGCVIAAIALRSRMQHA